MDKDLIQEVVEHYAQGYIQQVENKFLSAEEAYNRVKSGLKDIFEFNVLDDSLYEFAIKIATEKFGL